MSQEKSAYVKKVMGKRSLGRTMLLLVFVLAIVLSGCSSSSKDSSGSSEQEAPMAAAEQAPGVPTVEVEALSADSANFTVSTTSSSSSAPAQSEDGAGSGSASVGGIGPIADPDTGVNRKVIYKANVAMKVPNFDKAEEQLRDAIHLSGSYILQFNNTMNTNEKGASYVIKVPASGFSSFIDQLRKIQKDMQLQMEGSDVTEEYVDLNARLQAKKTVEARLLAFMDKAVKTDDLVRFSSELAAVQEQIEQIKGRMRYLDQNVAYSTVNVRLYEGKAELAMENNAKEDGFGKRLSDAITGSANALGQFGQALLVFLAALLPVAAAAAVIGVPVFYIVKKQRNARKLSAAEKRKQWNDMATAGGPEAQAQQIEGPSSRERYGPVPSDDQETP